jgi:hypothetical protein
MKTPAEELESSSNSETNTRADDKADNKADNTISKEYTDYRTGNSENTDSGDETQEELIEREPELEVLSQGLQVQKAKRFFDKLRESVQAALADEIVSPKDYSSVIDYLEYSRQ